MAGDGQVSEKFCERLYEGVLATSSTVQEQQSLAPTTAAETPPDTSTGASALADSFASLAVAIGWATWVVAFLALIGGVAWVWMLRKWAREEAQKAAEAQAKLAVDRWLQEFGSRFVRDRVSMSIPNTESGTPLNADELGNNAGPTQSDG